MSKEDQNGGLLNQVPVALGTFIYILCGAAVAIVASKSLGADDYVNYSAYISISGIFVLGVGAAIEQETNLVFFRSNGNLSATWRFMIPRVGLAVCLLWLLFLLPIFSWQDNLFSNIATEVQWAVSIGAPGLLIAAVLKGIANSCGNFRQLALSHIVFGLGTILLPIIIFSFGVPMLVALVVGQAIAWSLPLLILPRRSLFSKTELNVQRSGASHLSGWLMLANIALLTNLLSSQLIFRLYSSTLSTTVVAEAQVLIAVSCLAGTLTLALMPQIIANYRRSSVPEKKRQWMVKRVVLFFASVLALGTALFREVISRVLLPRTSTITFLDALLIATPAVFLVSALLVSGKLIAREKARETAAGWVFGLCCLWVFPVIFGSQTIRSLAAALFFGAAVAPVTFVFIDLWQRRHPN